jgi:3-phosphoshikimate 1-carboxyvinyltransferase
MPLPELIEIVPPAGPVKAEITVPGSKSITNRALVLAALAGGETILRGALWSEDTQVMVECLQDLGLMVNVDPEPDEACNRTITVYGVEGRVLRGGTTAQPLDLFVANAGTAARFLTALVCLGEGAYRLHGVSRMHERPQGALFEALRELGYRIESPNNRLPALVHGGGPRPGSCRVSIAESSQFASALLLGAAAGGWQVGVTGANEDEMPYVRMTREMIRVFPGRGGTFRIEPDASSGSYFWAAGAVLSLDRAAHGFGSSLSSAPSESGAGQDPRPIGQAPGVTIWDWPATGWQVDERYPAFLVPRGTVSRRTDLGDSIMTAIALAPLFPGPVTFTDLRALRLQECERVAALRTELTRCGARVVEKGDALEVFPSDLHGAEIETYHDHRVAMCFAILGLRVPGIRLRNPACVRKTFPNFFQKLAAPAPSGLGAEIRDAAAGRTLRLEELFAG